VRERSLSVEARIPDSDAAALEEALTTAAHERVAERLRAGDATLWGPQGTPEIANRLGWLTIAERTLAQLGELESFAQQIREEGFRDVVLLGMGGSSLAPEVLRRCFPARAQGPALHVLDTTDAGAIRALGATVELDRTLFIVSSKSGGTLEPRSLFAYFYALRREGGQFVAISDPGSPLMKLAEEHRFRRTFLGDPDIGGRYSALSAFGMVPGALLGVDCRRLLEGAGEAWDTALAGVEGDAPPERSTAAVWLGVALAALARAGRDKLTFLISPSLPGLGLWLEQLVAESTGKHSTGILPVAEEPLGEVGEYGPDRVFAYLPDVTLARDRAHARAQALSAAGHPLITVPTAGPADLGRVFMLWELAVAVAGWGLRINPFDQPNVQQAKDATNRVLADFERSGSLQQPPGADLETLRSLLLDARPPHYVALMAYCMPSREVDDAAAELRRAVRAASTATTTFGYGPRFLHSTGQFHKGGPPTGRFLQLTHDAAEDLEIPGAPYTFDTLEHAQAIGDLQTLRELGLPAERVTLGGADAAGAIRSLTAQIRGAGGAAAEGDPLKAAK
jgi:glucose-6-phosphate isomerase